MVRHLLDTRKLRNAVITMASKRHVAISPRGERRTSIGIHASAILQCHRRRLRIIGTDSAKDTRECSATDLLRLLRDLVTEAQKRDRTAARSFFTSLCGRRQLERIGVFARCALGQRNTEHIGCLGPRDLLA